MERRALRRLRQQTAQPDLEIGSAAFPHGIGRFVIVRVGHRQLFLPASQGIGERDVHAPRTPGAEQRELPPVEVEDRRELPPQPFIRR